MGAAAFPVAAGVRVEQRAAAPAQVFSMATPREEAALLARERERGEAARQGGQHDVEEQAARARRAELELRARKAFEGP